MSHNPESMSWQDYLDEITDYYRWKNPNSVETDPDFLKSCAGTEPKTSDGKSVKANPRFWKHYRYLPSDFPEGTDQLAEEFKEYLDNNAEDSTQDSNWSEKYLALHAHEVYPGKKANSAAKKPRKSDPAEIIERDRAIREICESKDPGDYDDNIRNHRIRKALSTFRKNNKLTKPQMATVYIRIKRRDSFTGIIPRGRNVRII